MRRWGGPRRCFDDGLDGFVALAGCGVGAITHTDKQVSIAGDEFARAALAGPTFARMRAGVDEVLAVPVPTIETLGGGGVRCMLAEVPVVRS